MSAPRPTFYSQEIERDLAALGHPGGAFSPHEVEAWLRLQYGTLDHLDSETFRAEIALAVECIRADPEGSRRLASTYGFDTSEHAA